MGVEEKKLNMRAQQIFNAVYKKGLKDLNQLSTIPVDLRDKLNINLTYNNSKIIETHKSSDGTIKFLVELHDKNYLDLILKRFDTLRNKKGNHKVGEIRDQMQKIMQMKQR